MSGETISIEPPPEDDEASVVATTAAASSVSVDERDMSPEYALAASSELNHIILGTLMKSIYLKRVKSSNFQKCIETIAPLVSVGNFDDAFEKLKDFRIGPNTLNNWDANFLWYFVGVLEDHDLYGPISKRGIGSNRDARDNFLAMIRRFIDQGVDLNHQDKYGSTVLIFACRKVTFDFCKLLLEYDGVDIDLFDSDGQTALDTMLTEFDDTDYSPRFDKRVLALKSELVRLLLLNGADPYRPYFNETTAPPTEYTKLDPYAWLKKDDCFFYKNPAHYVIEHSMEYAEHFAPEYKGREEEEPLRKVFFDTLKELGKA